MKNIDLQPLDITQVGRPLSEAKKALVMVHGRGASAGDILSLTEFLSVDDFAILAPQAVEGNWYPMSFLASPEKNEPWLSTSLTWLSRIVTDLQKSGIQSESIYWLGFSQGACLVSEFAARNAQKYGGVVIFTGGLIGDKLYQERYRGDFKQTKIYIGTSIPDPHVPVERVKETANLFKKMNAHVTLKVYPNMGHTINDDEIKEANKIFQNQ